MKKSRVVIALVFFGILTVISPLQAQVEESGKSNSYFGLDMGSGIWLENGQSPSETNSDYATRPWGSWYVSFNWLNNTRLTKSAYIDWGGGFTWLNWQLEDASYQFTKGTSSVELINNLPSGGSPLKSRLSATYIGVYAVPMLDLGSEGSSRSGVEGISKKGFKDGLRIGVGPYVGYRIGSRSKYTFKNDGKRDNKKIRDHFFLENTRYGVRAQVGYKEFEMFVAYDLNPVFTKNAGPNGAELNNLSIGITLVGISE